MTPIILHCTKTLKSGNRSNKVYIIAVINDGTGCYQVVGLNGAVETNLRPQMKDVFRTYNQAKEAAQKLSSDKRMNRGYVDITSGRYSGSLTPDDPWVKEQIQKNLGTKLVTDSFLGGDSSTSTSAPKGGHSVTCVNNLGLEDQFDAGDVYEAKNHSDSDMLYVTDKHGFRQECFKERFQTV